MKIRRVGAELFHADGWTDRQDGFFAIFRTRLKTGAHAQKHDEQK